jgi:hypothetical protein
LTKGTGPLRKSTLKTESAARDLLQVQLATSTMSNSKLKPVGNLRAKQ